MLSKSFEFTKNSVSSIENIHSFKQFLRSGTSIGANVEEAIGAQSKKDFIAKLSISYKELHENKYWTRLLHKSDYLTNEEFNSLMQDLDEMHKIIVKILITSKENL